MEIPANSLIYCDPPYVNTTGYRDKIDHDTFWQWCRDKAKEGHTVFISSEIAPDDFAIVKKVVIGCRISNTKAGPVSAKKRTRVERLFKFNG